VSFPATGDGRGIHQFEERVSSRKTVEDRGLTELTWQVLVVSAGCRHRGVPSLHWAVRCAQAQAAPPIERANPYDRRKDDCP
jgi:hypothetical protein